MTASAGARGAWFVLLLLALCGGCSNLDFSRGAFDRIGDAMDSGQPYVPPPPEVDETEKNNRIAELLRVWESSPSPVGTRYAIGPEDVLRIEVLSLEEPGRISVVQRTVDARGRIELPLVGELDVRGLTPVDARMRIAEALGARFIRNPSVVVTVETARNAPVMVTGAVGKPGIVYLRSLESTALHVISEAGGLAPSAGDKAYIMRRGDTNAIERADADDDESETALGFNQRIELDLRRLLSEGDAQLNVTVRAGDIISVPPAAEKYIYVLGYVARPGPINLPKGRGVTAMNALAMAGGLTPQGRAEKCYLVREQEAGAGKQVIPINLSKIVHGVRPDVVMESGDTLVIGAGFIMKLTEIFRVGGSVPLVPAP